MDVLKAIQGTGIFFFARARARAHTRTVAALFCIVFSAFSPGSEAAILQNCEKIQSIATAQPFSVSEKIAVTPHIKSSRGFIRLEGVMGGLEPKSLGTLYLAPYQNLPRFVSAVKGPGLHYSLAMVFSASLVGIGNMVLKKSDFVNIRTDAQVFAIHFPAMTVPSDTSLRLYVGSDDQLYYDAALLHPVHEGACRGLKK